jgi:8-oxo-dGTP pyrophosphatase MutT (NUDIX family)
VTGAGAADGRARGDVGVRDGGAVQGLDRALAAHRPRDARERWSLARVRALLAWLPAPLDETADPTHVTGSAVVLDDGGRVLLHRHKRLGIWLQPGGHLEPGESPSQAAVREAREETGVLASHPGGEPVLVHVDLHEGPRGHVHLDLRYLLLASADQPLVPAAGESPEVEWCRTEAAARRGDASLASAVAAALTRWRGDPR